MQKFWNWKTVHNNGTPERVLYISGTIAEDSWFADEVTPKIFKEELNSGEGNITLWINSPGGDCIAAAQIYNMLMDYKGEVTVKIDGIAASAASVIAMAGTKVLMSPVSMIMIHNPVTSAYGNQRDMEQAINMLESVKESIINAYNLKSGMNRKKLSQLMDAETWMDARKAVELGFADSIITRNYEETHNEKEDKEKELCKDAMLFSRRTQALTLTNKIEKHLQSCTEKSRPIQDVLERLLIMKRLF